MFYKQQKIIEDIFYTTCKLLRKLVFQKAANKLDGYFMRRSEIILRLRNKFSKEFDNNSSGFPDGVRPIRTVKEHGKPLTNLFL